MLASVTANKNNYNTPLSYAKSEGNEMWCFYWSSNLAVRRATLLTIFILSVRQKTSGMWCVSTDIRGTTHVHLMFPTTLPCAFLQYNTHHVTKESEPQTPLRNSLFRFFNGSVYSHTFKIPYFRVKTCQPYRIGYFWYPCIQNLHGFPL